MLKRKQNNKNVPWYRQPDYKGNMKESHKRKLDAFREQDNHPSTRYDDIPEDVQRYICNLEIQLYHYKQRQAFNGAAVFSVAGICILGLLYFGFNNSSDMLRYFLAGSLIIFPWFIYASKSKNISKEFFSSNDPSLSNTEEKIREEWELNHLSSLMKHEKDNSN
ncbi:hypothetical protein [Pseudochrobactrum asaccharolyticum]|uniref:hypothetical protein n=1 Tax=Pseudochrobactrum asaccharolyticum TaxID=354351 RepID=UPI0040425FEC